MIHNSLKLRNKKVKVLLGIACFLILFDIILTLVGIGNVGIEYEANPLVKRMILNGLTYAWISLKIFGTGLLAISFGVLIKRGEMEHNFGYYFTVGLLSFLIIYYSILTLPWLGVII